jgi:MEMO1 family protein
MVRKIPKAAAAPALILIFLVTQSLFSQRRLHYSSFSDQPDLYMQAIAHASTRVTPELHGKFVRCGIVSHHLLASDLIIEYFRSVAQNGCPKRIVLIGPDHARKGLNPISFSSLAWQTPFGILEADAGAVHRLQAKLHCQPDPEAFSNEHSVGALVPFIKYYFPDAQLVPILVRSGAGRESLDALHNALKGMDDGNTHFLLSSDFSHGKNPSEASTLDRESERVIKAQAYGEVWNLDHDCRAGLYVLLKLSAGTDPIIGTHTNSAEITGRPLENCTSYFTVFFTAAAGQRNCR